MRHRCPRERCCWPWGNMSLAWRRLSTENRNFLATRRWRSSAAKQLRIPSRKGREKVERVSRWSATGKMSIECKELRIKIQPWYANLSLFARFHASSYCNMFCSGRGDDRLGMQSSSSSQTKRPRTLRMGGNANDLPRMTVFGKRLSERNAVPSASRTNSWFLNSEKKLLAEKQAANQVACEPDNVGQSAADRRKAKKQERKPKRSWRKGSKLSVGRSSPKSWAPAESTDGQKPLPGNTGQTFQKPSLPEHQRQLTCGDLRSAAIWRGGRRGRRPAVSTEGIGCPYHGNDQRPIWHLREKGKWFPQSRW